MKYILLSVAILCSYICKSQDIIKINGKTYKMLSITAIDTSAYYLFEISKNGDSLFFHTQMPRITKVVPYIEQIYYYKNKVVLRKRVSDFSLIPGTVISTINGKGYRVDKCVFVACVQ